MKKLLSVSVVILLIIISFSCEKHNTNSYDFQKEIYYPEISKNFSIKGNGDSSKILITSKNPWQGAENISSEFMIVKKGDIPKGYNGQVLNGEAKRIICMSSTHIAMLDALNATDRIVGVSGAEYVTNPYIRKNLHKIPDIGYEGNIDYETLIATKPDLVLLFSVNGSSSLEPKLKELGVPFLYVGDYVEEQPMGKAEWIIPLAEVVGKRAKGIETFNSIKSNYITLKNKVKSVVVNRPKVMVNAPFLDSWFMPSTQSYVAMMIEDAGGDYIYEKNTGNSSNPIDLEEALKLASEADFWINISDVKSKNELVKLLPKFAEIPCVTEGHIYNNNLRSSPGGGNDCYESGVVHPDLILRDMIKIFHPELVENDFTYYHQLK